MHKNLKRHELTPNLLLSFKQPAPSADDGGEEGGGMTGGAVSQFRAVGARDRIWAEVSPC